MVIEGGHDKECRATRGRLDWFEIPVLDIERPVKFYSSVFDIELTIGERRPGYPMAVLPAPEHGVSGVLVHGEGYMPSTDGILIWLHGISDLSEVLDREVATGGKVLMPKTNISDHGFTASSQNSEGNRVGLHSTG